MDYNINNKQAFFNAAMGSVIRLDRSLNLALECRHTGDYAAWLEHLWDIRLECVPKWDEKIVEESMKRLNEAVPRIVRYGQAKNAGNMPPMVVQSAYQALMSAEEFIRVNADKVGLLNPNKADIMSGLGDVD